MFGLSLALVSICRTLPQATGHHKIFYMHLRPKDASSCECVCVCVKHKLPEAARLILRYSILA